MSATLKITRASINCWRSYETRTRTRIYSRRKKYSVLGSYEYSHRCPTSTSTSYSHLLLICRAPLLVICGNLHAAETSQMSLGHPCSFVLCLSRTFSRIPATQAFLAMLCSNFWSQTSSNTPTRRLKRICEQIPLGPIGCTASMTLSEAVADEQLRRCASKGLRENTAKSNTEKDYVPILQGDHSLLVCLSFSRAASLVKV